MSTAARALVAVLLLASGALAAAEPTIALDARLETLGIVSMLAGTAPEGFVAPDIDYARRARKAFAKFKDHPAVRLTAALPLKFDYRHRSDSILRRGPLPGLSPRWFIPDYLIQLSGGREKFEAWVTALAAFGREAEVAAFVRANADALEPGLSEFQKDAARRGYMAKLERSAGVPYEGEYKVYASVFHLRGSQVNAVVRLDEGGHVVQSVVGAEVYPGGRVDFRPDDFVATAGHEISHGLLDAASELSRDRIERSRAAYGRLPWNCYGDWLQCVKETVVRAHMLRLVETELGADAYRSHLDQEGRAQWPYLEPMVEKLKLYEKDRARWPDLYAYFPELLSVLPESAPSASTAPPPGSGPGPEWTFEETSPFATAGQRAFALRGLGRLLTAAPGDAALNRKRAAFRLLASDAAGAEKDAAAAITADPKDPAAWLARGLARRSLGHGKAAAVDFAAAALLCGSAAALNDGARVACGAANRALNGGALTGGAGADPSVGPGIVASPGSLPELPPSAPGDVGFEFTVDPRAELLAEVLASTPSAALPAAALLSTALKNGLNPVGPAQLLFSFGDPPELAARRAPPYGLASAFGGEPGMNAFVAAVRAQAQATGFAARWAAGKKKREDMIARAHAEARRTLSPRSVSQWLNRGFPSRARFVISETLLSQFSANMRLEEGGKSVEVRMRSVLGEHEKITYFSFDDFGGCPAHELTHTITDPLILDRSRELAAYGSLMIKDCTDNWTGCVLEHMVLGVTLRALRAERGDAVYKAMLKDYAGRGFPYLRALCERLAEYEQPQARAAGFAAFMPRALDVFRDELKARAHARAAGTADAAPAAVTDSASFTEEFRVDPRLELVVLLRRLASTPSERAREAAAAPGEAAAWDAAFLRFSTHPAVSLTARIEAVSPGLPPQLALHLSTGPALALAIAIPVGYSAAAGGGERVEDWLDATRAFAREARFFEYYASRGAARDRRLVAARAEAALAITPQAAAAYVGRALSGRHAYALSPLYPPSWPERLSVYGAAGVDVTLVRPARPGRDGGEAYGLDAAQGSTAREILYEEAERLVPAGAGSAGNLAAACSDRAAPAWGVCEREHLVEAALLRLRGAHAGRDGRAWPYLEPLLAKLAEYEAQRARWPSLADYWPHAHEAFGPAPAARTEDVRGVAFETDPRLELASVLLRLSGAVRGDDAASVWGREADEKFAAFSGHPAVARVAALARRGGPRLPLRLALALGAAPELSDARAPAAEWLAVAGGTGAWKSFAADARAFALEAHVWPFYDSSRARYAEMAARVRAEVRYGSSPKAAQDYLGMPLPRQARVLLAPLLPPALGLDYSESDASGTVRVIVRPAAAGAGEARFQFDSFGNSLVHALTHAATDPLVPAGFKAPGEPPAGCSDPNAQSSWRTCAQEYLVYAVTLRLLAAEAGEPAASVQAAALAGRGFPRLPELLTLLREYERVRSKQSTFAAFAPRLLAALAGVSPKRAQAALKLSDEGVAAYAAGNTAKAVELLSRAEPLDPEAPAASLSLGVCLEKLGRREAALAAYGRAIKRAMADPRRHWEVAAAALSSRASALEAAGRGREARRDLESARELAPDDWPGRDEIDRRLRPR